MTEEKDIETFVLDDDKEDLELLYHIVDEMGIQNIFLFVKIKELQAKLNPKVRVLAIDVRLNDQELIVDDDGKQIKNGADVLKYVRKKNPGCYVIIISQHVTEDIFIELINNQADWFIKKRRGYLEELLEQIKIGKEKVLKRDAVLEYALQSNHRIENRRKQREKNDSRAMD